MRSHRPTARAILVALSLWVALAVPAAASAGDPPAHIVFPVVGTVHFQDDFGAARWQGGHEGNDIMAPKRSPVVAAEAGKIEFWTTSASAGCMLYLYGRSGTTYLYIHLNNDLTKRNDNRGKCVPGVSYAPGLEDGASVRAGEMIAYVGDSGDANGIASHLHFELHPHDGKAVSPYEWLRRGRRLLFAAPPEPALKTLAATDPLTLVLFGTVRAAGDGELSLRVRRVRLSTGPRWDVTKNVRLAVAADALVQRSDGSSRSGASLGDGTAGEDVVVWTQPVDTALRTELGRRDAITARQILYR